MSGIDWLFVLSQVALCAAWGAFWRAKVHAEVDEANELFSEVFEYASDLLANPEFYQQERAKTLAGEELP